MARRSKYTPDVVERITQALAVGATYQLACDYAGISYQTFLNWQESKVEFFEAVKEAEGRAAVRWLSRIEKAAEDTWQAAAWKLERRYPEMYGRQRLEHTGADGQPLKAYIMISPDEWDDGKGK